MTTQTKLISKSYRIKVRLTLRQIEKNLNQNSRESPLTDILNRHGTTPRSHKPTPTNVTRKVSYEEIRPPVRLRIPRLDSGPQREYPLNKCDRLLGHRE